MCSDHFDNMCLIPLNDHFEIIKVWISTIKPGDVSRTSIISNLPEGMIANPTKDN